MSATNQNTLLHVRGQLEQLKFELQKSRILVSQAVQELKAYTEQNQREDPLVVGIPASMNPFKEKRPCNLLWEQLSLIFKIVPLGIILCNTWTVSYHEVLPSYVALTYPDRLLSSLRFSPKTIFIFLQFWFVNPFRFILFSIYSTQPKVHLSSSRWCVVEWFSLTIMITKSNKKSLNWFKLMSLYPSNFAVYIIFLTLLFVINAVTHPEGSCLIVSLSKEV